jgi:alanyl aminopeptidase
VDPHNRAVFKQLLQSLYSNKLDAIGLSGLGLSNQETIQLRQKLVSFLALIANQTELRQALIKNAIGYVGYQSGNQRNMDGIDQNTITTALKVAVNELGRPFLDTLQTHLLESRDATFRKQILSALGSATDEELAREAREWILSPKIRDNEWYSILYSQLARSETRDAAWNWVKQYFNRLIERMPNWRRGQVARTGRYFCSVERRKEVETFFADKIKDLEGGPRSLANTLEAIDLCVASVKHNKVVLNQYLL